MGKQPQNWSPEEKFRAVMAYEALEEEQKGKYLRGQGLYAVDIERWRAEVVTALEKKTTKKDPQNRRVKETGAGAEEEGEGAGGDGGAVGAQKKGSSGNSGAQNRCSARAEA